ncbi:MAG: GGDEF domain-containing protein [Lachnospiraceae bacterium]|nr:GGDEF domain-containing protein [Lachnospiraceae bacterium]
MQHKNIAVLMTALDSDAQADTLKGIEEYAKKHGCNIAVFLWFTGAFEKDKHNLGEINILNLPDLNLFDGVILLSNALHMENNKKKIKEMLENTSCPLVCIGCKIKNSPRIQTDNYAAMRKLVEHYVVDHQMRKIHFVKGVKGNEDGEARFRAYVDVLTEHGIPVVPERISQGDFYVTGGAIAAKEILNSSLPFPEAIVCANDIMASTICEIFMEKGYRIPEDVVISGYDCTLEGQIQYPKLTTVRSCCKELGEGACKLLLDQIEGKEVPAETYLPDEVVYGESCGCHNRGIAGEEEQHMIYGGADIVQRKLIHQMIMLEKNIIESNSFEDWLGCLREFIAEINPSEFYCCVNEDFVENVFERGVMEQEDMSVEERLAYSPMMQVILAYQNGIFKNRSSFEAKYAFEDLFHDTESGKLYIFSPMHYLDRNFGYFVFVDSTFPVANQLYVSWLIKMGDSIENIRKQSMLRNAMKRLDEMYVKDSLTGVYNRFGMERYFTELKKRCLMSRVSMQVSFVDIDGLKLINDKYGHEEGDRIINTTAKILQKKAGRNYVIRYGGDEFIVIGTAKNEKEVENYWNSVQEEINIYNQTMKKQAEVSISYGYDIFNVDANTYLEDCIHVTDKKMYIEKNRKKHI